MEATVTITGNRIIVVSVDDLAPEDWLELCHQHGLRGRPVTVDDYTTDGDRHQWVMTLVDATIATEVR